MKRFRIIGLTLPALLALGAFAAGTAFAEEGVLPQQGTKAFKITGGAEELLTLRLEKITCTGTSGQGTLASNSDQKAVGTFTCTGATVEGLSANTLGDAAKTIKATVSFLICLVDPEALKFGLLIAPTEAVHVEIPTLKTLILFKGAIIAELESTGLEGKEWNYKLENNAKGDQTVALECEINKTVFKHTFESSVDTKPDTDASVKALFTVAYLAAIILMET